MNNWLTCSRRALGWLLKKNPALTSLSQFRMRLLEKRPGSTPDIGTLKYFCHNLRYFYRKLASRPHRQPRRSHQRYPSRNLPRCRAAARRRAPAEAPCHAPPPPRGPAAAARQLQGTRARSRSLSSTRPRAARWSTHRPRSDIARIKKYFCYNSRYFYLALQDIVDVVAAARLGEATHSRHWNQDTLIRRHF